MTLWRVGIQINTDLPQIILFLESIQIQAKRRLIVLSQPNAYLPLVVNTGQFIALFIFDNITFFFFFAIRLIRRGRFYSAGTFAYSPGCDLTTIIILAPQRFPRFKFEQRTYSSASSPGPSREFQTVFIFKRLRVAVGFYAGYDAQGVANHNASYY